jgi:hypothetical protein
MSPSVFAQVRRLVSDLDVRGILGNVKAPTLVVEHEGDTYARPGHGRYLAEHIPGARHVIRPGTWGLSWLHDADWLVEETQAFLTGTRALLDDDRVLATVLFTDIVDSTGRAATVCWQPSMGPPEPFAAPWLCTKPLHALRGVPGTWKLFAVRA